MLSFFVRVLAIWAVVHAYIALRLIVPSGMRWPWSSLAWLVLGLSFVLAPSVFFLSRLPERGVLAAALLWTGYVSMGLVAMLLPLLVVRDLVWLLGHGVDAVASLVGAGGGARVLPVDPERRRLLANVLNVGLLGVTGTLGALGFVSARRLPRVVRVKVPIAGLAPELEGLRIVQLTDVHIGPTIKGGFLRAVVERANGLGADLVAVTGDLVDGSVEELRDVTPPSPFLVALGTVRKPRTGPRPWPRM